MSTKSSFQSKNSELIFLAGLGALLFIASRGQPRYGDNPVPTWGEDAPPLDPYGEITEIEWGNPPEAEPVRNPFAGLLPRGVRNNNPGNIRRSRDNWQGLALDQSDPEFFRFATMADGVRAMAVILLTYTRKHGLKTPAAIVNRWAPPNENDTAGYARTVARALGVDPLDMIDTQDPAVLVPLMRAMIRMENGAVASLLISDADVAAGVARALQG